MCLFCYESRLCFFFIRLFLVADVRFVCIDLNCLKRCTIWGVKWRNDTNVLISFNLNEKQNENTTNQFRFGLEYLWISDFTFVLFWYCCCCCCGSTIGENFIICMLNFKLCGKTNWMNEWRHHHLNGEIYSFLSDVFVAIHNSAFACNYAATILIIYWNRLKRFGSNEPDSTKFEL